MRSGWVGGGGGVTDEKGGVQEKGGSGPPDPPSGHAYVLGESCTPPYTYQTEEAAHTVKSLLQAAPLLEAAPRL